RSARGPVSALGPVGGTDGREEAGGRPSSWSRPRIRRHVMTVAVSGSWLATEPASATGTGAGTGTGTATGIAGVAAGSGAGAVVGAAASGTPGPAPGTGAETGSEAPGLPTGAVGPAAASGEVSQLGSGRSGTAVAAGCSGRPERRKADVPRARSWPIVTASMSAETRPCCPSRCSVRTFNRPCTTTGSPSDSEAAALVASCGLAETVTNLVWPSVHMPFSRSQYRAVTASRNRTDGPDASSRYTGDVATLPTAQTIVSFIASPSRARHRWRRPADTRTGPSR